MDTLKMPAGRAVSSPEGASEALVGRASQHSCAPVVIARDAGKQMARSMEIFPGLQALAKPRSLRMAIKVRRKILFINLADVVAVQAEGKCVLLWQNASSYL